MLVHSTDYTNKQGVPFRIDIFRVTNPPKADFWAYRINVMDMKEGHQRKFKSMVLKKAIERQEGADGFMKGDPLSYVKHNLLDHYDANHDTPMYLPEFHDNCWTVN